MFPEHFSFHNPQAAHYFFVSIPLLVLFTRSVLSRKKRLRSFAQEGALSDLLFLEKRVFVRYGLLTAVWIFLILALMGPEMLLPVSPQGEKTVIGEKIIKQDEPEKVTIRKRAYDVSILIDTSASMSVTDTRMKVSRLDYAKEIVDEIISRLDGQNVALYAFTSEVTPLVPPTPDYFFTRLLLRNIGINEGDVAGTDLFEVFDVLNKKILSGPSEKRKAVILLTDGGDTGMEKLTGEEREKEIRALSGKIEAYQKKNTRPFIIGLGTKEGEPIPGMQADGVDIFSSLDGDLLRRLSEQGRGRYYFADEYSATSIAESLAEGIEKESLVTEEEETVSEKIRREASYSSGNAPHRLIFQLPLGLAVLLLAAELLLPNWPRRRRKDA